jgi:hypothetical protein
VCRPGVSSCDPEERCTGNSPYCPEDQTAPDGNDCGDGLKCASGQCTSRNEQCKSIMGSLTQGSNDTYACDNSNCMVSCASPAFGDTCYGLRQNFLDGTPCGAGGKCQNVSSSVPRFLSYMRVLFKTFANPYPRADATAPPSQTKSNPGSTATKPSSSPWRPLSVASSSSPSSPAAGARTSAAGAERCMLLTRPLCLRPPRARMVALLLLVRGPIAGRVAEMDDAGMGMPACRIMCLVRPGRRRL